MPRLTRRKLFWKYAAYLSGLVSALLLMSGALGGYFAFQESVNALEEIQRAKAGFVASEIARFMDRVESALQSTTTKFGRVAPENLEDLRLDLIALFRHQPAISDLHWVGADGRETLALSRVVRDSSYSGVDWSDDAGFKATRAGTTYVGPVNFRHGSEPYVSLAVSRNREGPMLFAEVNLKFVGDVLSKVQGEPGDVAYVVDGSGRLVSHPDISLMLGNQDFSSLSQVRRARGLQSEGGRDEDRNLAGRAVLAAMVPIERLGWTILAEQPRDEALRPVYASVARSVALVALGLAAAVAASLVLARRMVRPIRQIEAGAFEIGEGSFDRRIDVKTGDELEALGAQFNRMATRLQEIYATQEARIAERTRDLAQANEAKTRFLAAASHDLRQPIHALSLFVGQLRENRMSTMEHALLEKIENSVEALDDLLEALLDLSKLDVGAVTPAQSAFPVQDLLSRLVADFAPAAEAKGLALTLAPTSVWVRSDPLLLERILLNLVANAIRYTVEGRILVGCRRRANEVEIVVADTGAGIAPEHIPNIFQEFYQAGPRQGGLTKGLGLGLAIVKRLVLLLDHQVNVDSQPGKGTVVRIRVPRVAPEPAAFESRSVIAQDLTGTRVLVVDDEAAARDAIRGLLLQWGCDVITADRCEAALQRTRGRTLDLVLCDLNLANGESGIHVVAQLRNQHGAALPCAYITGESSPERILEARAAGDSIALKPTRPGKLRALIEHMLRAS